MRSVEKQQQKMARKRIEEEGLAAEAKDDSAPAAAADNKEGEEEKGADEKGLPLDNIVPPPDDEVEVLPPPSPTVGYVASPLLSPPLGLPSVKSMNNRNRKKSALPPLAARASPLNGAWGDPAPPPGEGAEAS